MIEQNYNLNTIPSASPVPIVHVSQYDKGLRTLKFKLFEGSEECSMASVNGAIINGKKPDGNVFSYDMTIMGNIVSVSVTEQMTAVAGRVIAEIVLSDANDGILGTANFIIEVEESPIDEGVMSDSDIPIIEKAAEGAAKIEANLSASNTAASNAATSEANAKNSETNAAASANSAGKSATAAASSAAAAAASEKNAMSATPDGYSKLASTFNALGLYVDSDGYPCHAINDEAQD